MKKIILISSIAIFLFAASFSYASNSILIEQTPVVQEDDDPKTSESETTETKEGTKDCSSKKSECSKDCKKSCCTKEEK